MGARFSKALGLVVASRLVEGLVPPCRLAQTGASSTTPSVESREHVRRQLGVEGVEIGRLVTDAGAAFLGGTMGVAGTLAVYENNRFHAKQRVVCAYCEFFLSSPARRLRARASFLPRGAFPPGLGHPSLLGEGSGFLTCGACLGSGKSDGCQCSVCKGNGKHTCVNCEATGLAIPAAFERKEIKAQDDELERQLDEIGIAALADDIIRAENSPGDMAEVSRMLQRRALSRLQEDKK